MRPLEDREIAHDTAGDAALYDRYGQAIFAYARLHTPSREDAEDLTLEVFTIALEQDNLAGLSASEQLAWLRRVAHNKLIDGYRRSTRHPQVGLDTLVDILLEDDASSPEQILLQREAYAQLHQAVQALPQVQQQVLRLRYGSGLRFADIAVLMNKREGALRKLLSRTLATLRATYTRSVQRGGEIC